MAKLINVYRRLQTPLNARCVPFEPSRCSHRTWTQTQQKTWRDRKSFTCHFSFSTQQKHMEVERTTKWLKMLKSWDKYKNSEKVCSSSSFTLASICPSHDMGLIQRACKGEARYNLPKPKMISSDFSSDQQSKTQTKPNIQFYFTINKLEPTK